eukprot:15443806-Alexandrium_andersonii.AAC.1
MQPHAPDQKNKKGKTGPSAPRVGQPSAPTQGQGRGRAANPLQRREPAELHRGDRDCPPSRLYRS